MTDIELTEEQRMLAESASDFLAKHSGFDAVRRLFQDDRGYDEALWREMASLGWLGVVVPEAHGGAGWPLGTLVSLAEPMGRHLYASPWLATTLAGRLLDRAGSDAQRAKWLPRLASGDAIGSVALTEPDGSWELTQPMLSAREEGAGYVLDGAKTLVLDAAAADLLLVSANLDGAPAIFAIETSELQEGALRRLTLIDEGRRAYRLDLSQHAVAAEARLSGGDAGVALHDVYRLGALLFAADMSGGTEGVMALTLEYLQTRKQFGRLIGSYQALKHPMVEIMVAQEQARSLVYHAATICEADAGLSEIAIRMAKAHGGDTFTHAVDRAIQFHGAIGFTYECHAQLYFRRAQLDHYSFGDSVHHRRRLEPLLLDVGSPWDLVSVPPPPSLPGS